MARAAAGSGDSAASWRENVRKEYSRAQTLGRSAGSPSLAKRPPRSSQQFGHSPCWCAVCRTQSTCAEAPQQGNSASDASGGSNSKSRQMAQAARAAGGMAYLAERIEAGEAQGGSNVSSDTRGREEVSCVREQLDRPRVVEQDFIMFARSSREPSSGATSGSPQSLGDSGVGEHCR